MPFSPRRHPAATVSMPLDVGRARAGVSDRLHAAHGARTGSTRRATRGRAFSRREQNLAEPVGARRARDEPADRDACQVGQRPAALPGAGRLDLADAGDAGRGASPRRRAGCTSPSSTGCACWSTSQRRRHPALLPQPEAAGRRLPRAGGRALVRVRGDAVLDGEVVAVDPQTGQSSFSRLQRRMQLRDAARAQPERRARSSSTCSTVCSTRGST